MKCRHCGNNVLGEVKYCTSCGKLLNETVNASVNVQGASQQNGRQLYYENGYNNINTYNNISANDKAAKNIKIIFIVIFIIVIVPSILIFALVFGMFSTLKNNNYVKFNNINIPTVYTVLENKDICSYSSITGSDDENVEIEYCDSLTNSEIKDYLEYLVENEGFEYKNDYSVMKLLNGKYMVTVRVSSDNFTIYYDKYIYNGME